MLTFVIDAGPNTTWKARVVVHPDVKSLRESHPTSVSSQCLAFCKTDGYDAAFKNPDGVFAEIHLARGKTMKLGYIVHECYHCWMEFCRLTKLKLHEADYDGEEISACGMEHLVGGIVWMLNKRRIKIL